MAEQIAAAEETIRLERDQARREQEERVKAQDRAARREHEAAARAREKRRLMGASIRKTRSVELDALVGARDSPELL